MNWDQIESKWAAMTRRVRADWMTDRPDAIAQSVRRTARSDARSAVAADRKADSGINEVQKSSNE